ncbi:hypothetical protein ACHAPU_005244 [Fusarium lateritium]
MSTTPDSLVPTGRPAEFFDKFPNEVLENFGKIMVECKSFRSLANFILAYKPGKELLEKVLYTEDISSNTFDGFTVVMTHNDQDAVKVLSKYPVDLIKLHVNTELTRGLPNGVATYTMLHFAAARGLHQTIRKLHELGAEYLETANFRPMLDQAFQVSLQAHIDRSVISSEFTSLLHRLKWKPAFAVFIQNDIRTYVLLHKLWDASEVGTWNYEPALNVSGPPTFPMTIHHLAVFGDNSSAAEFKALQWSQRALVTYPHNIEAPAGETKCSVLHLALKANNRPVFEYLVRKCVGFQAYFVDSQGNNPLHTLLKLGLQANTRSQRAEWKKLEKVFFKATSHLRWNPMMPQTQYPFQTPLHMAMANIQEEGWVVSKFITGWIIDFVLAEEKRLLEIWDFPFGSIVLNHSDAEGHTPLSLLFKAIDHRDEEPSGGIMVLLFKILREGGNLNFDANSLFTPRRYAHSISYMDRMSGRSRVHVRMTILFEGGRQFQAELTGNYPNLPPTDLSTIVHAHSLPHGHPMFLPEPFCCPLLPPDEAHAGYEMAARILDLQRGANLAITAPPGGQTSATGTEQDEAQA